MSEQGLVQIEIHKVIPSRESTDIRLQQLLVLPRCQAVLSSEEIVPSEDPKDPEQTFESGDMGPRDLHIKTLSIALQLDALCHKPGTTERSGWDWTCCSKEAGKEDEEDPRFRGRCCGTSRGAAEADGPNNCSAPDALSGVKANPCTL